MFFEEHEKRIYKPDWSETGFDPLHLERLLVYHSRGRLYEWIADRNSASSEKFDAEGDVSADGKRTKVMAAAAAELELAPVARAAFGFPDDTLDAVALERLYEFLGYMEKKGAGAGTPPGSPESSPPPSSSEPTTTT